MLLEDDVVVTNNLILAELIPFLKMKRQGRLIELLRSISNPGMEIDWNRIIALQYLCLENGLNGVAIPDLLIADNAMQHQAGIFSLDTHFPRMAAFMDFEMF